jgi:putative ATP-binding cassette transporter
MGLPHLCQQLDRVTRWDHELTDPEQQGLAFARLLLHKPRWVLIDEAIDSLAPAVRKTLLQAFGQALATTTLIYISGPEAEDKFYTRALRLTKNPQG